MAKNEGGWPARVVVAFVGYIGPSSFGLGAAKLIELGYAVIVLWLTLFLLGILLLLLRWSFGLLTVTLAGGLVYIVGRYTPASAQIVTAYAISWLLLLSGVRGILVRGTQSGDGGEPPPAHPHPALHLVPALASVHTRGGRHRRQMDGHANLKLGLRSGRP